MRFLRIADFYKDTLNIQNEQTAEHLAEISRLETLEKGVLPEKLTVENLVRLEKEFGISLKDLFL